MMSLPLYDALVARFPQALDFLLNNDFYAESLIQAITGAVKVRISQMQDARQREVFQVDVFKRFIPYFTNHTTLLTCTLLKRLSGNSTDFASFFFGRLPSTIPDFLHLFCFLVQSYRDVGSRLKDDIRHVVEAMSYKPESRNRALKMLCGDQDAMHNMFLLASSETDDVDALIAEIAAYK